MDRMTFNRGYDACKAQVIKSLEAYRDENEPDTWDSPISYNLHALVAKTIQHCIDIVTNEGLSGT